MSPSHTHVVELSGAAMAPSPTWMIVTLTSARSIETYMSHCLAAEPSSSFGHPRRRGLIDTVYWPARGPGNRDTYLHL